MKDLISDNSIIGLDLGTVKICASVCTFDDDGQIHIAGVGTSITEGLKKGVIVNIELYLNSIKRALARAERIAKITSKNVVIGFSSSQYRARQASGVISIPDTREIVTTDDKLNAIKKARQLTELKDYTTLHTIPLNFFVDDKRCTTDPVGMFGATLKTDIYTIHYKNSELDTIKQIADKLSLNVLGIVASPLATCKIAVTQAELEGETVMIDLGGATTQITCFSKGIMQMMAIFPVGGEHISSDLQIILNTTIAEAERLKQTMLDFSKDHYDETDSIAYQHRESDQQKPSQQHTNEKYLNDIAKARLDEILTLTNKTFHQLYKNNKAGLLVVTGGTANIPGIEDYIVKFFKTPVRLGIPKDKKEVIESQNYATSIGLVVYAIKNKLIDINKFKLPPSKKLTNLVKKWFKDFF